MDNVPSIGGIPATHRIVISIIIVIACLGLLENAARIYEVYPHDPFSLSMQFGGDGRHGNFLLIHRKFIRDPELFWRTIPNLRFAYYDKWKEKMVTESTNSKGFRGEAEFGPKNENTYRIITLGDSWTYGVLVEDSETYPHQLSCLLNDSSEGPRFEVFNLGCVGYSSYQGKVLINKYIEELKPDLTIVCFGGNDARRTKLFADKDQPMVSRLVISMQRLLRKSALYNFLRNTILRLRKGAIYAGTSSSLSVRWPQRVSPDDYENNLKDITSICGKQDSRVVLLCYKRGPYKEKVEKISREMKIPFIDIYGILHSNPDYTVEELTLDYPRDTHPNAKGYSLLTNALHNKIKDILHENM